MALFYWNSSLETGNDRIDRQHRRLFALTNDLADAVRDIGSPVDIERMVDDLRDYAANHFCDEEKLMGCSSLPAGEQNRHRCLHRQFLERVEVFASRHAAGDPGAIADCLDFLVDWLVLHILKMDHRIVRALPGARDHGHPPSVARVLIGALVETERRFRQVSDEAPTMIWVCGPTGARDFVNKAWQSFLGRGEADVASAWTTIIHPDDAIGYSGLIDHLLAQPMLTETEYRIRRADGTWAWVLEHLSPRTKDGAFAGLVAAASDITPIKHSEAMLAEANRQLEHEVEVRTAQLREMANTDALTGVANRRRILDELATATRWAESTDCGLVLLYIDIDHFKMINDAFGHSVGDEVLVAVVKALAGGLRPADLIGRVGGEEFIVIVKASDLDAGQALAEHLRQSVERLAIPGLSGRVTVSIGVAGRRRSETGDRLIDRADAALLAAKRAGRNRLHVAGEPDAAPASA